MKVFLETERLILRQFTEDDVDNLHALDSDPDVMQHINGGIPTPRDEIEHDYLPAFLSYYERGDRYGFWAIVEKVSGDFLGWIHFRPLPGAGPDEPELGYRLRKAAWGKGYATEASAAVIRKGFTELGVQRVVASTDESHTASRRVMDKLGMTLIRTYESTPEDPYDGVNVEYALDRTEWEQRGMPTP